MRQCSAVMRGHNKMFDESELSALYAWHRTYEPNRREEKRKGHTCLKCEETKASE